MEVQEPELPSVEPVSVLPEEPVVEPVPVLEVQEPLPSTEPVAMFPEEQSTPDPLTTPEEPVVDEISQNDLQALEQSVLPDNNLGTAEPVEPVIPVMENTLEPNANMTNEALVSGKKKKRLPIVSIIIGVIVVVLAGLAGYLAYNKFVGQKQTAIFNNYEYTINGKYNVKKFDNTRLLIMDDKEEAKATWIITIMPYTDYETFADVKSNAENVNTNLTKLGYMIDNTEYTTINGTDVFIATVKKDDRTFQEIILPNKSGSLLQANISQKDGSTSEVHLNTLINIVNTSVKK